MSIIIRTPNWKKCAYYKHTSFVHSTPRINVSTVICNVFAHKLREHHAHALNLESFSCKDYIPYLDFDDDNVG